MPSAALPGQMVGPERVLLRRKRYRAHLTILPEIERFQVEPSAGIVLLPYHPDNPFHLQAAIEGPADSLYAGGVFTVDIQVPDDYPLRPPQMVLTAPIVSCAWDQRGHACLPEQRERWSPRLSISKLLVLWQRRLMTAVQMEGHAPGREAQYALMCTNRPALEQSVREAVYQYAQPSPEVAAVMAGAKASAAAAAVRAKK